MEVPGEEKQIVGQKLWGMAREKKHKKQEWETKKGKKYASQVASQIAAL